MAKQQRDKPGAAAGEGLPRALEILKCREGNKEFMRERPAQRPFGGVMGGAILICEYSLENELGFEHNARTVWKLAKRAARDFLRNSWLTAAIVTCTKTDKPVRVVRVYGKY